MSDLKWMSQMKRGLLELCILNLVGRKQSYGYEIVQSLSGVPGLVISLGTIYPLLSRLKREGYLAGQLVESDQGPARRSYQLTAEGRRHVRAITESWREIADAVERFLPPGSEAKSKES